jgi:hypothetical protein
VCKNLLQETAQRAGVSLPVYTTIRSGPKHLPLFKCMVEVGGRRFMGEPAKTKKQAEKNAAMAAWSSLRQRKSLSLSPHLRHRHLRRLSLSLAPSEVLSRSGDGGTGASDDSTCGG